MGLGLIVVVSPATGEDRDGSGGESIVPEDGVRGQWHLLRVFSADHPPIVAPHACHPI